MRISTQHWNEFWYHLVRIFFQFFLLALFLFASIETVFPDFVAPFISIDIFLYGAIVSGVLTALLFGSQRLPFDAMADKPHPGIHKRRIGQSVVLIIVAILAGGFVYLQLSQLGVLGIVFSISVVVLVAMLNDILLSESEGSD